MKILLRPFLILFCLLFAFPSMAEEDRLQRLISQAEAAIARNDEAERSRIIDQIFELMVGLEAQLKLFPESLSAEEYEKRACIYFKVIAPLHTREELEIIRHEARFRAYRLIKKRKMDDEATQIRMDCVQDDGDPVPEAKALHDGLAWAKLLAASGIAEEQAMAREYEVLLKRHPDDEMYQWFNLMMGLLVDGKRAHRDVEESSHRLAEMNYRRGLAEKANKGDVAVQLELARRLENGDKFEQNIHFSYYWYNRAQQNGGGEEARKGMERLHPRLTEIDLMRVDNWMKKKYRMY